ncbi:MAG: 7-cyano-7-deazaguanine synthase, partial [Parachlamydiaceae bacterium]|nr:7-cyano-7-deazaguanine synthase [Parachlamydiaceae bacterium]
MKAIVLLSGGLDSTVVLAMALEEKKECFALSFDYGQKHHIELISAKKIADHYKIPHQIIKIDPNAFKNSSLTSNLDDPKNRTSDQ